MPFNGAGTFTRVHSWATDKINTIAVTASRVDSEDEGIATGLSNTICKDGQSTTTARIPFVLGTSAFVGTVASVSYSFTSDPDTGLYSPAADQWALAAGGTQTLRSTAAAVTLTGTLTTSGALTVSSGGLNVTGAVTLPNDLGAIEALSGTGTPRRTGVDTWVLAGDVVSITFVIESPGGSAITTGIKGDLEIPFDCTINQVTLLADQSGSIVVDIWKDTFANYPPTVADTITAAAKPTISATTKSQDSTLTGWTTAITAGNTLRFNVDSCTSITRVTLALKATKTN